MFTMLSNLVCEVNLNTATLDELMTIPGITPQIANCIIAYRHKYKDFQHVYEIYNACWEMNLPISMDYVKNVLVELGKLYAVTPENWKKNLADTYYDLHNPSVIHFMDGDYLVILHDGGYIYIANNSVTGKQCQKLRKILKGRGLFGLAKPTIDWLVITKPDIDARELAYDARIERVYIPKNFEGRQGRYQRARTHYVVRDVMQVDLYQNFSAWMVIVPEGENLRVELWYNRKRVVISPTGSGETVIKEVSKKVGKKTVKTTVKETYYDPNVVYNPVHTLAFDNRLFYYLVAKPPVKKPRPSVTAEEARYRLREELKEEMVEDLYEELESAQ